ncbi:hypothetical protein B0H11DRAFT_1991181 [Mycena galericulata]|nr:hypothetical protein B0H11DRAFT_1991181 [Mycena galericulata]
MASNDTPNEPPRAETVEEELLLYKNYMDTLRIPGGFPSIKDLKPVYSGDLRRGFNSYLHEVVGFTKPSFCFPNRVIWCPRQEHALVFCPTHHYDTLWGEWSLRPATAPPTGKPRPLFVSSGTHNIFYVGTYMLLDLRHIHPPGSPAPTEISRRQLNLASGIPDQDHTRSILAECFPDGVMKTECFGLQRVGFDDEFYSTLQQHWMLSERKRKAGEESGKSAKKRKSDALTYD